MSESASGFVPGSGAGALVVESLEHALSRGARIYAEILGGHVNSGGQTGGGTMTAPNSLAVQRCIKKAIENAGISPNEIDAINGHLTATAMDATEISNWATALNRKGEGFPSINALKGMTGHCLTASGSVECVASVLQIHHQFLFPNVNCEDIHPEITSLVSPKSIPLTKENKAINTLIKASFGFGDLNACILFKKFEHE